MPNDDSVRLLLMDDQVVQMSTTSASSKYVTVPSRYAVASRTTSAPMRGRRQTVFTSRAQSKPTGAKPKHLSSVRHSSPKPDSGESSLGFLLNDSVASAVLPAHPQLSERRRSLSTGTLQLNSSSHSAVEKDGIYASKALKVGWIMLERRIREVNAANNSKSLAEVKQLLEFCESRGQQLRALQISNEKWNQWLRINHALESENAVLESLIRMLGPPDVGWTGTEHKENRNPSTDDLPSSSAGDLIAKLKQFTATQITPIFNRLPLRGFTTDADEADIPILATGNVERFVASSEVELCALEQLADLIDRVANQLESNTVPLTQTQAEKLISAAQLFAHEASLRFECLQRQWLNRLGSHT
ncbi:hypothetical protein EG68_04885 [Paragonimus skrjabini miyazakii]|uniref:Uncharacterized protein n=1 Tax=Paragonimus skrjabini miyazakii TaxID=59628 RepID=A0A8S9YXS4_9TREM|nr:hypothetical protein EG68_04885 [Paragonimus skrjabini miyazakii]